MFSVLPISQGRSSNAFLKIFLPPGQPAFEALTRTKLVTSCSLLYCMLAQVKILLKLNVKSRFAPAAQRCLTSEKLSTSLLVILPAASSGLILAPRSLVHRGPRTKVSAPPKWVWAGSVVGVAGRQAM